MTKNKKDMAQWVKNWKQSAPALQEVQKKERSNFNHSKNYKLIDDMLQYACEHGVERTTLILFLTFFVMLTTANAKPIIFVSILPQQYFVERIAADHVDISVMVKPGENPALYEPSPRQMADLSKASAYFSIGVPFERKWLPKIRQLYPKLRISKTDIGIKKRILSGHDHDYEHKAHSETSDPHIWLSPPLVMLQARQILLTLQQTLPDHYQLFQKNYHQFINDIVKLDLDLIQILNLTLNKAFMVFHPSWGYFADAYGLHQIPVEIEGKDVRPSQLAKLIEQAKMQNIRSLFVQPQFSVKSATVIAQAIKGKVVMVDPLALDWDINLKSVARKIKDQ